MRVSIPLVRVIVDVVQSDVAIDDPRVTETTESEGLGEPTMNRSTGQGCLTTRAKSWRAWDRAIDQMGSLATGQCISGCTHLNC
jgi:hypothetical protein